MTKLMAERKLLPQALSFEVRR